MNKSAADATLESLRRKYQHQQMMLHCLDSQGVQCQALFQPVLTDRGVCYALNAPPLDQVMKPSPYLEIFNSIYPNNNHDEVFGNLTTGYKVRLILDSHQSTVFDHEPGAFWLGINQRQDFMAVREKGVAAWPGMHTHIIVSPVIYESSDSLKSIDKSVRNCLMPTENLNTMFSNYSFKSCDFRCKLQSSRKKCGCTPWNYPQETDAIITEICDGVQAFCFEQAMGEDYDRDACSCLQDCDEVVYDVNDFNHKVDFNQECDVRPWEELYLPSFTAKVELKKHKSDTKGNFNLLDLVGEKMRHMDGAEFKFWMKELMKEDNFRPTVQAMFQQNRYLRYVAPEMLTDKCTQLVQQDLVFITIEVRQSTAQKTVRDVRFTFTDKISALGGTIGLFTGMSLLSIIETIYWLLRCLVSPLRMNH